jgi:hypothetical protein
MKKTKFDLEKTPIDPDVIEEYSKAIEQVMVDTHSQYSQCTKLELLVVLISFAAQISMDLEYSEEDFIYVIYKLYGNVKKEKEKYHKEEQKKEEIPAFYDAIYGKKAN